MPHTATPPFVLTAEQRLDQAVSCVGFLVHTATTDNYDRVTHYHSPVYPTRLKADQIAAQGRTKLHSWEREIVITVEECQTAFPLRDVLAGKATRLSDWRAQQKELAA